MVGTLLDTNVISELQRVNGDPAVKNAIAALPSGSVYVSALTVGELVYGVSLLEPGFKRDRLEAWIATLRDDFSGHILPIDEPVATAWGSILARAQQRGIQIPRIDGLIAATAIVNGLKLMTRNAKDVQATGVKVINPWQQDAA